MVLPDQIIEEKAVIKQVILSILLSIQVYKCTSIQVYKSTSVQVHTSGVTHLCKPKVCDLQMAIAVQEKVLRLQVPENIEVLHGSCMCVSKRVPGIFLWVCKF